MPCDTIQSPQVKAEREFARRRLETMLAAGQVTVVISSTGAIAFKGWSTTDRRGYSDVCAYRHLLATGSSALRQAVARAEVMSGRKLNPQTIASGVHSHDGGQTWGSH